MAMPVALVLDDDDGVRDLVAEALRAESYETILCRTKEDLDRALCGARVDVFLIDVMLPDGNGLQIARELRQKSEAGIILLTARGEEMDKVLGLELGADDYVTKPFRIRELRARVNAVYRRTAGARAAPAPEPAAEETLRVDALTIVPAARTVKREGGEHVDLTTMEFDVLLALARARNRVLSRDQIMDAIRGPGWAAYDRTIDGLISRLRTKLFPDGTGARWIKTVRGVGYMLAAEP